jgi:hypothetical protein
MFLAGGTHLFAQGSIRSLTGASFGRSRKPLPVQELTDAGSAECVRQAVP